MNKLAIFFSFSLISISAHSMNYEVVGPVEREESIFEEAGSTESKKLIAYSGFVKRTRTNELFAVSVERESNPAFANPVITRGRFGGMIAQIFENQNMGPRQDLQLDEVILLFSKFSQALVEAEIIKNAAREQERQALLAQEAAEKAQRKAQEVNETMYAKSLRAQQSQKFGQSVLDVSSVIY
jgi:hypothetical protein